MPMSQKLTLEDISERKRKVLSDIQAQKKTMTAITQELFSPFTPVVTNAHSLMRSFNTGMAVFDGVMLGIKVIRKLRKCFKS